MDSNRLRTITETIARDLQNCGSHLRLSEAASSYAKFQADPCQKNREAVADRTQALKRSVQSSKLNNINPMTARSLEHIGAYELTGDRIYNNFMSILNQEEPTAAISENATSYSKRVSDILIKCRELSRMLHDLIPAAEEKRNLEGKITLVIPVDKCTGQASISSLEQLDSELQEWNKHIKYIQEIVTNEVKPIKILGIENGSFLIELGAAGGVAAAFLLIVNSCLDIHNKVLTIRREKTRLSSLELDAIKQITEILEESETREIKLQLKNTVDVLCSKYCSQINHTRSESEIHSIAKLATTFVFNKINTGREVYAKIDQSPKPHRPAAQIDKMYLEHDTKWSQMPSQDVPNLQLTDGLQD